LREQILEQLKSKGERLDHDLAAALSAPLQMVRNSLAELASRGEVVLCQSIQFRDGERIEGLRCRVAAYAAAMGRGGAATSRPRATPGMFAGGVNML